MYENLIFILYIILSLLVLFYFTCIKFMAFNSRQEFVSGKMLTNCMIYMAMHFIVYIFLLFKFIL